MNTSSTATRATGWRGAIRADQVVAHNLVLGAGTMAAGVLGVAFQSIVSHRLQPADYGAVFAVVSLVTLIGLPAGALTLLMAREASRDRAQGTYAASAALLRGGNRVSILAGLALATVLAVSSPVLGRFLNVPAELLLAAAAGAPFAFASPLLMGELRVSNAFSPCRFCRSARLASSWSPPLPWASCLARSGSSLGFHLPRASSTP